METTPVTLHVPPSSSEPMVVEVRHSGLRMVIVDRASIRRLDASWDVLGVYVLIGPSEEGPGRHKVYVGEVGKATLKKRVAHHAHQKEWWSRVLLVANAVGGFNSAEIGWLEGRLYRALNDADGCVVANVKEPGDESLPPHEQTALEKFVAPIEAALRACGIPLDRAEPVRPRRKRRLEGKTAAPRGARPPRPAEREPAVLAAARGLPLPLRLHGRYRGAAAEALLMADGTFHFGEKTFASPSDTANAAKLAFGYAGRSMPSTNGWTFWSFLDVDGVMRPLAALRTAWSAALT